jgi:hypothetical protein
MPRHRSGGITVVEPRHASRAHGVYQRAASKASNASFTAKLVTGDKSRQAHTQAVAAHHHAAEAATKAGMPEQAQYHRGQANQHSFSARNGSPAAKTPHEAYLDKRSPATLAEDTQNRKSANLRSEQAQRASAGANGKFGAEGAKAHMAAATAHRLASTAQRSAGNVDKAIEHSSKAGHHELSAKIEHGRTQGPGYTREAIAHGSHEYIRAGDPKATKGLTTKVAGGFNNTHDQHAATANARNATAQAHAREGSSDKHAASSDHRIAATAHGNAANKYMYGSKEYRSHVASADYHSQKARELDARKAPTNLGAKVTPQVPHAAGATPHPLHKTGGALPTGDASTKAHTQTAKANAKPSLASHSIAAKSHMNAAGTHHDLAAKAERANLPAQAAEHRASAAHHEGQAQSHRIQAQQHSQRIQKLKKLGPGQHHGTGGRFTGTPGGAK